VRIPADGSSWIEAETTLDDGATCNSVAIVPKLGDFMLERATMFNMRADHRHCWRLSSRWPLAI
jgi:hypothetical protein